VALADGSVGEVSFNGQGDSTAPSNPAPKGSRGAAPSSFEQAFRVIDDCLRKETGCGTELDYTHDLRLLGAKRHVTPPAIRLSRTSWALAHPP
jgi:hypothetical protein